MNIAELTAERLERAAPVFRKLRAMVLLAGSVRRRPLGQAVQRLIVQLPVEKGFTILDAWRRDAVAVADARGNGAMPIRMMVNYAAPESVMTLGSDGGAPLRMERDPDDYRGTGGILRDMVADYEDQDYLLIANAAQILLSPLVEIAGQLAACGGDVSVLSNADGTPSGLFLARCGVLRDLPDKGFVDLKEQALPMIAARHHVMVLEQTWPNALPVRTLAEYIESLRRYHDQLSGRERNTDPFSENHGATFAVVEDGAEVHPKARLHDSVVLRGGRVEADAVVVRSIVCPGGVLRRGQMAVDALVSSAQDDQRRE